jgi:hypothetical protein
VGIGVTATAGGAGTPTRWLAELRRVVGRSSARLVLSLMVWGRDRSKTERMHGDSYLEFHVTGDGLKVAVGGGLDFSSFDGVARPHPRFSAPRNWFPRFLALSLRSFPVQLLREATNLVPAVFASVLGFDSRRGKFWCHGHLFIGENPSTSSGRGDDLGSISNWKQIASDHNEFGKGMNSVGYEFVANSAPEPLGSGTLG